MNNNLFELKFDSEFMDGVYGISIVEDPAIGVMALKFNKENKVEEWKLSSEEKRIIVSPVLIPDQRIYRKDISGTGEGYVFVTAETIEQLQQNYFKKQFNHNSSIEHIHTIDSGVYVFESWIIDDPENDKSNSLGFENLPKGTWMISMKIENDSIWNNFVKTGKVNGISMDALLQPVRIEENNINKLTLKKEKMNKSNFKNAFKQALTKVMFAEDRKEFKISDELSVYAESLELGKSVYKADGELMVESEFQYEGNLYKINAEGKIETIEAINSDDPALNFEFNEEMAVIVAEVVEEIKDEMIDEKDAKIAELEAKIMELETKLGTYEKVEEELIELKKQTPATKGIKTTFNKQTVNTKEGILGAMRSK